MQVIDYFISNGFDTLINPALPCPTFDIGQGANFMNFLFFSSHYNFAYMPRENILIAFCDDTSYSDSIMTSIPKS